MLFAGKTTASTLQTQHLPPVCGWDMDTFLVNRLGKRTPLRALSNLTAPTLSADQLPQGLGVYPGKVRGQIWQVAEADFTSLQKPPFDTTILLANSLDPGWIPYFAQVEGVASHVGGLLSHASIILRESRIPSITALPAAHVFKTGDWVELDGSSGILRLIPPPADNPPDLPDTAPTPQAIRPASSIR